MNYHNRYRLFSLHGICRKLASVVPTGLRWRHCFLLLLASLTGLAAATAPEAILRVATVGVVHGEVSVVLANVSRQTVTAYSYVVTARYGDGHEMTTRKLVDDVSHLVAERLGRTQGTPAAIRAGETRTLTARVPNDESGAPPVSVSATITMVAMADRTASGDAAAIESLRNARATQMKLMAPVLADLRRVRASSSPKEAADSLVKELTAKGNLTAADRPRLMVMMGIARSLEKDASALDEALTTYAAHMDLLAEHSKLEVQ